MNLAQFREVIKSPPNVFVIMANDYDLRTLYLKQFCKAHRATPTYVDSIDWKSKGRILGNNQVFVLTDDMEEGVAHRAARYYRFDKVIYNKQRSKINKK